jgi:hypothetical protein
MKAKNILMTLLLVTGAIAAKAAGYPAELALVSQPVMVYNAHSITVYYDVENIGDYTYRGSVCLYLYPDEGYSYAEEWVKVRPGRIKRIAIDIPSYLIRKGHPFTIMPYYEMGDELYSFTTFEYFEPITFFWEGPRNERWVVINIGPCPSYYNRPGHYRYYYDGYRPPMPPPGHGPGTPPPPMDPKHHTYGYHHNNGGYPGYNGEKPEPGSEAPKATVRPKPNGGSMSHGHNGAGSSVNPPAPNSDNSRPSGNSNVSRPSSSSPSNSGSVSRPSTSSGSSRPNGTNSNNGSSSRKGNSSNVSRPSSSSSSNTGRVGSSTSSSSRASGTSATSRTSGTRSGSSSSARSTSSSGSGRR